MSNKVAEIKETDIVFDCPYCGKSLAIDYRGAGLTIQCSDCGKDVPVPIPEGMELADIDSSEKEQETRIIRLRKSLAAAEFKIKQLESEMKEVNSRREILEKIRARNMFRFGSIHEKIGVIQMSMKKISESAQQKHSSSLMHRSGKGRN